MGCRGGKTVTRHRQRLGTAVTDWEGEECGHCGDTVSAVVTTPAVVINAEQKRGRGRKRLFWLMVQGDGAHYRGEITT